MTKKLNEEQRSWIETAKVSILHLQDLQNETFNDLMDNLMIEDETDINWIFDFIYNAGSMSDEYYKMVESSIFE